MGVPTSQVASAGQRPAARDGNARRFIVGIAAIAALGGALFGYDTGVISGALPFMEAHFGLTSLGEGVITSALLIGAAFGSLIGGRMSDALGRRNALLWAGAVFIGGAVAVALSPTVPFMTVARFVLGLAVGSASVITPLYLSEIAPPRIRGRLWRRCSRSPASTRWCTSRRRSLPRPVWAPAPPLRPRSPSGPSP